MLNDFLAKDTPKSDEMPVRSLKVPDVNENPIAYQNLTMIKKFSKGKFPIYLASSKIDQKVYAIKIFSVTEKIQDSEKFYKNEIRFAFLNHPTIIKMIDYKIEKTIGLHDAFKKVPYILFEYAPYGDLADFVINHKSQIDEKLARTYFRQLIQGIEYLHGMGVAHLDLKPQNVLLDANFNLKIADFDLSYMTGDNKIRSRGTRYYRAPELFNATTSKIQLELPFAADIYSACVILFVLKSGGMCPHAENYAIEGLNMLGLMNKKKSKFWEAHCEMQGKDKGFYDSKFKDLFNKMMETNPKQRPSIKKIKASKWYNGPVYSAPELYAKMKTIFLAKLIQ